MSKTRRLEREQARDMLAQAYRSEPRLVTVLHDTYEMWMIGKMLVGLPMVRDEYPDEMKRALTRRRQAMLTGQCACGGRVHITGGGMEVWHTASCIAGDTQIDAIARRHGSETQRLPDDFFDGKPWKS